MPWVASGVHVLFADKHEEWKFLQRWLAGERFDWWEPASTVERILFQKESVVGDLGEVRPGLLDLAPIRKRHSP